MRGEPFTLYYAVHKRTAGLEGVVDVTPGVKRCLTSRNRSAWVNADIDSWKFIDGETDGWFFERYELEACAPGTSLTDDAYSRPVQ